MLRALMIVFVIGIALLQGGALRNFSALRLRWVPLVIGGFVLQLLIFTPFRSAPLISGFTAQLYILSMALLIVWVAVNWRIPGMALMAIGLLLNSAAIVANGGYMPVSTESARYAGTIDRYANQVAPISNNSIAADSHVQLWLLTDIIAVPGWVPLATVVSIGDVLLTLGVAVLCYRTIRSNQYVDQQMAICNPHSAPEL